MDVFSGESTQENLDLPAIFIGNHFTLDELDLIYISDEARRVGKSLIALDNLYWVQSYKPHLEPARFSQGNPGTRFKFGSSFTGILKVTDERLDGVMVYRSIIIDVLIYTQKILAEYSIEFDFDAIRMDDVDVLRQWRGGPSPILSWLGVRHHSERNVDHIFSRGMFDKFSTREIAYLFLEYKLIWLEYHYPREFYSAVTFMGSSFLPAQLEAVANLAESLKSSTTRVKLYSPLDPGNGFLYPGCHIVVSNTTE